MIMIMMMMMMIVMMLTIMMMSRCWADDGWMKSDDAGWSIQNDDSGRKFCLLCFGSVAGHFRNVLEPLGGSYVPSAPKSRIGASNFKNCIIWDWRNHSKYLPWGWWNLSTYRVDGAFEPFVWTLFLIICRTRTDRRVTGYDTNNLQSHWGEPEPTRGTPTGDGTKFHFFCYFGFFQQFFDDL